MPALVLLRAVANPSTATVDPTELKAYVDKLCASLDTAGQTMAADLLAGGAAAHKAFLASGDVSTCPNSSDADGLFYALMDVVNPRRNQDVEMTVRCALCRQAAYAPQHAQRVQQLACRQVCTVSPAAHAPQHARRAAAASLGLLQMLHQCALLEQLPHCSCLPFRYVRAWAAAGDELGWAICVTLVAVDTATGQAQVQTIKS